MIEQTKDYEARICSTVDQVTARYRDALADVGLRLVFRGVIEEEGAQGEAEARIAVYEGDKWIDSIEFFVRRADQPVTSPVEVEEWLSKQLERLVSEHPWGGGWEEA